MKYLLLALFPAFLSAQVTIYDFGLTTVTDSTYQFTLDRRQVRGQATQSETAVMDSLTAADYAYNIMLDGTTFPDGVRVLGARDIERITRRAALVALHDRVWAQTRNAWETITSENYDTTLAAVVAPVLAGTYQLQTPSTVEPVINLSLFRAPSGILAYRAPAVPLVRALQNGKVLVLSEGLIEIRALLSFEPIRLVQITDTRWTSVDGKFTLIKQ